MAQGKHKRGDRGIPPHPLVSLDSLPDDAQATQTEVAGYLRKAKITVEKNRMAGTDGLEWVYPNGWPRCVVGSLRKVLRTDKRRRRAPRAQAKRAGLAASVEETVPAK